MRQHEDDFTMRVKCAFDKRGKLCCMIYNAKTVFG